MTKKIAGTDRPLFSIVMPTRNRAHLLSYALQSALDQTFDDYEIIVSDNFSQDDTEQVARGLATDRVRYFRTPAVFSMPDSWEFAVQKARGEWILFLSDDDAIVPYLLERILGGINQYGVEVLVWRFYDYFHPNWFDPQYRNLLELRHVTQQAYEMDSREMLARLYDWLGLLPDCPRMTQSVCHRRIIADSTARTGRFFRPIAPDFWAAVSMLSEVKKYLYLDESLMIAGTAIESTRLASVHYGGNSFQNFFHESREPELFKHVPLKFDLLQNVVSETLLRAKESLGNRLAGIELNWVAYYAACYGEMSYLHSRGVDQSERFEEFQSVLGAQPNELREAVQRKIPRRTPENPFRKRVRELINHSPILSRLELTLRPRVRSSQLIYLSGEKLGFKNILECAREVGGRQRAGCIHCQTNLPLSLGPSRA